MQAYGFIPIIGPVLSVFATFLNEPPLMEFGRFTGYVSYVINFIHFFTIVAAMLLFIFFPEAPVYGWIFVVVFVILAFVDSFEEASELMTDYRRIKYSDFFLHRSNKSQESSKDKNQPISQKREVPQKRIVGNISGPISKGLRSSFTPI